MRRVILNKTLTVKVKTVAFNERDFSGDELLVEFHAFPA